MGTHVEARFIGKQRTLYVSKHVYQLEIEHRWSGRYAVTATHGYYQKRIADSTLQYSSLGELLQDWLILSVLILSDA